MLAMLLALSAAHPQLTMLYCLLYVTSRRRQRGFLPYTGNYCMLPNKVSDPLMAQQNTVVNRRPPGRRPQFLLYTPLLLVDSRALVRHERLPDSPDNT